MTTKNSYRVFNNLKQSFVLVKLTKMKLRWIKAIYQKIGWNLITNIDQKTKKVMKKRNTFDSVNALYEG